MEADPAKICECISRHISWQQQASRLKPMRKRRVAMQALLQAGRSGKRRMTWQAARRAPSIPRGGFEPRSGLTFRSHCWRDPVCKVYTAPRICRIIETVLAACCWCTAWQPSMPRVKDDA